MGTGWFRCWWRGLLGFFEASLFLFGFRVFLIGDIPGEGRVRDWGSCRNR